MKPFLLFMFLLFSTLAFAQNTFPEGPMLPDATPPETVLPPDASSEQLKKMPTPPIEEQTVAPGIEEQVSPQAEEQIESTAVPEITSPATTAVAAASCPPVPECPKCQSCERGHTETYRDDSFGTVMLGYQYVSTWVVGKQIVSYTQIINAKWSLEFEYAQSERDVKIAGYEIGNIDEARYTLFAKYYVGNSFHVSLGPFMYDMKIEPSNKIQDVLGNRIADSWELEAYGVAVGFGSRWQAKNGITWGIDWLRMNVPLQDGKVVRRGALRDEDQRETKRSFKIIRTVPTFAFVGISIGYTF